MATYFVVNAPSNLIVGIVTSSYIPANTALKTFVLSNEKSLDFYYRHLKKDADTLLDIGELMQKSSFVNDRVTKGKGGAKPMSQRIRAEQDKHKPSREEEVRNYLVQHSLASADDLSDALHTGIVAARAYMIRYGY
ncbi:hypothetical protein [Pseudomonas sp. MWU13-2100]|uniref:hypothetical protein n=1 Tax=Pseudomonas sp. MWU13-2100 TaxID=2935075 RepID=UPI00200EE6F8|nr:hypothetical protein [Pseudomonas sp. MWU13-2100]